MKKLIFSYGTLMLPQYLERFKSEITHSVYIKGFKIICTPIQVYKKDLDEENIGNQYNFLQLVPTEDDKDIVCGFIISTSCIADMDRYEGKAYKRVPITAFTRTGVPIECETYTKNQ